MKLIDRLEYARNLCRDKHVVDIGGARMKPENRSAFDLIYLAIRKAARGYVVIDRHPSADVVIDLDSPDGLEDALLGAEVVLCMETLEHLRNPGLVCDAIAKAVRGGAKAFITFPRTSMLVRSYEQHGFTKLWGKCEHLYGFDDHHAAIFMKHNFAGLRITPFKCCGTYLWWWPLVMLATFGRGGSFGYLIQKQETNHA